MVFTNLFLLLISQNGTDTFHLYSQNLNILSLVVYIACTASRVCFFSFFLYYCSLGL
jgi:hypothetical protein